ncbi:MAG: FtsQ-type POTRA domain-containing protein [Alphaproteobacteria bacterium]|nr:FtsQ-type POTRA domain-containing protein [Alphaproteobacteria bacterium]
MASTKIKRKSKGTRASYMRKKLAKIAPAYEMWAKRIGVGVVVLVLMLWGVSWLLLPHVDKFSFESVRHKILSKSASAGFEVKNILVEGRNYTDSDILLALLNIKEGDPIFSFHPKLAKEQVERIGWVKSVRIERRLPDTIYVRLHEREPAALWQDDEDRLHLIDSDGEKLTQKNLGAFKHLLMIKGEDAAPKSRELITVLKSEPALLETVDHAHFLDKRRWDLYLKNGMQIKLPENGVEEAMRHLMIREEQDNILTKENIEMIDARYKDRLIVKTRLGEVQDYKSGLIKTGTQL